MKPLLSSKLFTIMALMIALGRIIQLPFNLFLSRVAVVEALVPSLELSGDADTPPTTPKADIAVLTGAASLQLPPVRFQQSPAYPFANPAGCAKEATEEISAEQRLVNVQNAIAPEYNLAERRQSYIWNGEQNSMLNVTQDAFVYEYVFNEFQHPLTYRADKVATIFMTQGFVVWFRAYAGNFRLLAVPMVDGVLESAWSAYIQAYWQRDGLPQDSSIYPVMKKLPCHWVIDAGYVSNETLVDTFHLDWHIPDYLLAGRRYLASTCAEANRISQEKIGYSDATSMCGPLAWTIMRDANAFPYRIGSWSANAATFTSANPRWNGQPWGAFDPETFTLTYTDEPMPGFDFAALGNLYPGDVVYSYATLYVKPGYFDHIFVVAGIDANNTRLSISNMVRRVPSADCSIEEIALYIPGDRENGVINREWNGSGLGRTGTTGFDIFRWNWITYHLNGQSIPYTVRWGDTIETIAFDWKAPPQSILEINVFAGDIQLTPGQVIVLPAPEGSAD